ncbi:hypothetical protein [Leisingera daeponensis]|uniref:hypothetical protein n=1 Tax=Leisingera daeponensis TaxID=405746 RepID=UPI001C95DD9A|nr:hypothetical protein [Leisingera daeponensis]MBY6055144.1 hypothetical protein [Leisingera daeponensis]
MVFEYERSGIRFRQVFCGRTFAAEPCLFQIPGTISLWFCFRRVPSVRFDSHGQEQRCAEGGNNLAESPALFSKRLLIAQGSLKIAAQGGWPALKIPCFEIGNLAA